MKVEFCNKSPTIFCPSLYTVEILICVCGFVEMTDFWEQDFFFSMNMGENVTNSAGGLRMHFAFHA